MTRGATLCTHSDTPLFRYTHRTNEKSNVIGMHNVNQLGPHITDASVGNYGEGGSWCTCHLSAPMDVCHKQFGAKPAW